MAIAPLVHADDIKMHGQHDVLSAVLRSIRLGGSLQFGFIPTGDDWFTDTSPSPFRPPNVMPFHIVAEGTLWLKMHGEQIPLQPGDIVAFQAAAAISSASAKAAVNTAPATTSHRIRGTPSRCCNTARAKRGCGCCAATSNRKWCASGR